VADPMRDVSGGELPGLQIRSVPAGGVVGAPSKSAVKVASIAATSAGFESVTARSRVSASSREARLRVITVQSELSMQNVLIWKARNFVGAHRTWTP